MTKCGGRNCSSNNDNVDNSGNDSQVKPESNGPSLLVSILIAF
jgi:hypothetical protein